jgi:integrase
MSIKKIGANLWQIRASVRVAGKVNPATVREKFRGTKIEAECRQAELVRAAKSSRFSLTSQKTITHFSEAVDPYVDNLRAKGRLSITHGRMIEQMRREFGAIPLKAVPDRLDAFRRAMYGELAGGTLNRYTSVVRAVFSRLVALEVIPRNPITQVRFPKFEEKSRDRYLTAGERVALFDAIQELYPDILPLIRYMIMVPCRVSELTTAKREQYNRFTNTIYVPDSKAGIPINKPVPEEMTDYFMSIPDDCPWLFYRHVRGRYLRITHLQYAWRMCLARAEISDLRIHDLRHIAATDLYEAGNSERLIADVAGWKTPNMLSVYYHKDSMKSAREARFKKPDTAFQKREVAS